MKLEDLKIMVTGGASGMGAHFARRLHEAGAKVAVGDVNEAMLSELPPGLARRKLDVSKEDDVASFVEWAAKEMGGVNSLVNNAGISRSSVTTSTPGRSTSTADSRSDRSRTWRAAPAAQERILSGRALATAACRPRCADRA